MNENNIFNKGNNIENNQNKVDYILGKKEGYITYSAINARLKNLSEEEQLDILENNEFIKYSLDYVLGKTQSEPITLSAVQFRLGQVNQKIRENIIKDEEFIKYSKDYVLGKTQSEPLTLSAVLSRLGHADQKTRENIIKDEEFIRFIENFTKRGAKDENTPNPKILDLLPEDVKTELLNIQK